MESVQMLARSIVLTCLIFALCNSAFIDHIEKCSIKDGDCQRDLLQSILQDIGKTGIPDLGIPPTDPYVVKDVTVSILDLINITMVDGVAKGIKDCIINKFETHIERGESSMELTCDIIVKGKYKVEASSPLIKNLLGGSHVHGEGIGKVMLEKFHVKFDYIYRAENIDGLIYLKCNYTGPEELKYKYSLDGVKFAANNLYLGRTEASQFVISIMNDNWKLIMDSFGKPFIDKAIEFIYVESHKFFNNVPTKYYITEDLSEYVYN